MVRFVKTLGVELELGGVRRDFSPPKAEAPTHSRVTGASLAERSSTLEEWQVKFQQPRFTKRKPTRVGLKFQFATTVGRLAGV